MKNSKIILIGNVIFCEMWYFFFYVAKYCSFHIGEGQEKSEITVSKDKALENQNIALPVAVDKIHEFHMPCCKRSTATSATFQKNIDSVSKKNDATSSS